MHGAPQSRPTVPAVDPNDALEAGAAAAEAAVQDFIAGRINFERLPTDRYGLQDFKLERMRALLRRLGDPQQKIPIVHLAGTKGKGSTAVMTAAILTASGRRTGLFTSPHIEHFSERMTIDGSRPPPEELRDLVEHLRPIVGALDEESAAMRPTFFEVLTAMAWLHFRSRSVDAVVLETGLGGRLDATNVCEPAACIITTISRDHERLLGTTLAAIAAEKAGIIKPSVPIISGVLDEEPRDVIRQAARRLQAPLYELADAIRWHKVDTPTPSANVPRGPRLATIDVTTPWRDHQALPVPLAGDHQADNLALAVAAVDLLNENGLSVSPAAVCTGVRNVHWPLRVEAVHDRPLVIVDAAHNIASVEALLRTLQSTRANRRLLVFSTSKDKDAAGMLARLAEAFDHVILTRFINNPRAVPLPQLETIAREVLTVPWTAAATPADAWRLARKQTCDDDLICATGSFFLAAEFRTVVRQSLESVS